MMLLILFFINMSHFFSSLSLSRKQTNVVESGFERHKGASVEERECSSTGESNEGGSVWRRSVHCVYNPTHGCREEEGNPLTLGSTPDGHWCKKRRGRKPIVSWFASSIEPPGCDHLLGNWVSCHFRPIRGIFVRQFELKLACRMGAPGSHL